MVGWKIQVRCSPHSSAWSGTVWSTVEHARIRMIAERWYNEHPDVVRQRLAG